MTYAMACRNAEAQMRCVTGWVPQSDNNAADLQVPIPVPLPFFSFTGGNPLKPLQSQISCPPACYVLRYVAVATEIIAPAMILPCALKYRSRWDLADLHAGWRGSFNGDLHMYGHAGVQFYTQPKTVRTQQPDPWLLTLLKSLFGGLVMQYIAVLCLPQASFVRR